MHYLMIIAGGLAFIVTAASSGQEIEAPFEAAGHRAFDFWIGQWEAGWQRKDPAGGLDAYLPLTQMTHRVMPVLSGKALIELAAPAEDNQAPGLRGFSIRYFDAASGEWIMAQHWPSPDNAGLAFTDQLRGAGGHGRQTVYSHAAARSTQDQTVVRRYTFSDIGDARFRWDMGITSDEGATWATPLVMHLNRTHETAALWTQGEAWFGQGSGASCTGDPHGAFDALAGHWSGTITPAGGEAAAISWTGAPMLDGCAVGGFLTTPAGEEFVAWSYSPQLESWVEFSLSDRPGEGHEYMTSQTGGQGAVFSPDPSLLIESRTEPYYGLETGPALRRSRWTRFTADEVAVEIETRGSTEGEWVPALVMRMEKAG